MAGGERAEWEWEGEQQLVFDLTQAENYGSALFSRAPDLLVVLQPCGSSQAPLLV